MEEQELTFDNYNTLDYAMSRHDIDRFVGADNIPAVNKRMRIDGWVPSPSVRKMWHHEAKRWQCPHCDEIEARSHEAGITIPF